MHDINEKIIKEYIKKNNNLNEYRANQDYNELHKFTDIEEEFVYYVQFGWKSDLLYVEGFTAKKLHEEYPLTVLGAYNYLVYLREEPKEALNNLNKGLPRR